jgi:Zn finger protein HypA/HybF involved in hydrogenase expression
MPPLTAKLEPPVVECRCCQCGGDRDPGALRGSLKVRYLAGDETLAYERKTDAECPQCGSRQAKILVALPVCR